MFRTARGRKSRPAYYYNTFHALVKTTPLGALRQFRFTPGPILLLLRR